MGNKNVFIGGISGGIGSALSNVLLSGNWTVSGFSLSGKSPDFKGGVDVSVDAVDGTDSGEVTKTFEKFVEKHGRMDAYIHSVGSVFLKPLHLTSDKDWDRVRGVNLDSTFYALREAVKIMQKQKYGQIVLVSSVAVQSGLSNHEAIAAAKGGVEGLVRSAAATYSRSGVRVNGVALGLVETQATKQLTNNEQAKKVSTKMHPLGELGDPGKVASLISWLISEDSSWVIGQVWTLDGGMGTIVPKPKL